MTSATTLRSTGNGQLLSAAMPPFAFCGAPLTQDLFCENGGCHRLLCVSESRMCGTSASPICNVAPPPPVALRTNSIASYIFQLPEVFRCPLFWNSLLGENIAGLAWECFNSTCLSMIRHELLEICCRGAKPGRRGAG
jgi:hypothetical protein